MKQTRRAFLADVGRGVLAAGLGPALAADLGLGPPFAPDGPAHRKDMATADQVFAAAAAKGPEDALNEVLLAVEECLEVHRVVLPYRAWDLLPIIGREHAQTLLRQSVHYCVKTDNPNYRSRF